MWILLCKRIFALGFWISAISFGSQAYMIIQNKSADNVSLFMFIMFALLNINSIFYSKIIAKDRLIMWGAVAGAVTCILVLSLIAIY